MPTDHGERLAVLEHQITTTNDVLLKHLAGCEKAQDITSARLSALERMAYIGVGATIILSGVVGIIGGRLLKLLGG